MFDFNHMSSIILSVISINQFAKWFLNAREQIKIVVLIY